MCACGTLMQSHQEYLKLVKTIQNGKGGDVHLFTIYMYYLKSE